MGRKDGEDCSPLSLRRWSNFRLAPHPPPSFSPWLFLFLSLSLSLPLALAVFYSRWKGEPTRTYSQISRLAQSCEVPGEGGTRVEPVVLAKANPEGLLKPSWYVMREGQRGRSNRHTKQEERWCQCRQGALAKLMVFLAMSQAGAEMRRIKVSLCSSYF
ncbi:hypothetical protein LY76DRAFT_375603 [Colletotrichum caudatum]|nr:hypothetical protein LY76DRAFT_375603 [Colletotrichum caudatum]